MAKSGLRLEAIKLREQGKSVRDIAKTLGVAKSSASLWVRHVILTLEQAQQLTNNFTEGARRGQLKGSFGQKRARLNKIKHYQTLGIKLMEKVSPREYKIAGLCLYWAEGTKTNRSVVLCNSDPNIITFFINWLERIYEVSHDQLKCYVGINIAHQHREAKVKAYWSEITNIPLNNFTKTSFKNYPLQKIYANFEDHYGTLTVKMLKPGKIYYQIMGEIHGLAQARLN